MIDDTDRSPSTEGATGEAYPLTERTSMLLP